MNIVVAGGTGFIGRELVRRLLESHHEVVVLTRDIVAAQKRIHQSARLQVWDGRTAGDWWSDVSGSDAVINLCGELLAGGRWTEQRKKALLKSRIEPTLAIVEAVRAASVKPRVLVNGSAVGYYGAVDEGEVTEAHSRGVGFLADLCELWEQAARKAESSGVRVVLPRSGVVLGDDGGALERMVLPFKLFVGGPIGSGKQWFPWVHRDDLVGAISFALEDPSLAGAVNVVAPESVTMGQFCSAVGAVLGRPSWAPVPPFVLRIVLGELAEMLLTGQRVVPSVLMNAGYTFRYPRLISALSSILRK